MCHVILVLDPILVIDWLEKSLSHYEVSFKVCISLYVGLGTSRIYIKIVFLPKENLASLQKANFYGQLVITLQFIKKLMKDMFSSSQWYEVCLT